MRTAITHALLAALLLPPTVSFANDGPTPIPEVRPEPVQLKNVELSGDGEFIGQLITGEGAALAGEKVTVSVGDKELTVITDENGRFVLRGLPSGRCVVSAGNDSFACRVWQHGTAPPESLKTVALVRGEAGQQVRGQFGRNYLPTLTTGQKLGLGLLAIGGVAVAIAVAEDDAS